MGKKYIIELNDECNSEFKGIMAFGLTQEKQISIELITEESMTHYTEDAAYAHGYTEAESKYREIRDELEKQAYEKGVQDTKQHWVDAPRTCAYKCGYENGLNDLWEAMQKAIKMYCEIDNEVFLRVFHDVKCDWGESVLQALFKNTPQHLIDSIRKYEQRQEEEIQIGDEVIAASGKAVVMGVGPVHFEYFNADGSGYDAVKYAKKTGRHFPEIAEVLRKMKETE